MTTISNIYKPYTLCNTLKNKNRITLHEHWAASVLSMYLNMWPIFVLVQVSMYRKWVTLTRPSFTQVFYVSEMRSWRWTVQKCQYLDRLASLSLWTGNLSYHYVYCTRDGPSVECTEKGHLWVIALHSYGELIICAEKKYRYIKKSSRCYGNEPLLRSLFPWRRERLKY